MADIEKKPTEQRKPQRPVTETSSTSGIVDPIKDELAKAHNIPGVGDPLLRKVDPDEGRINTPPLSEQEIQDKAPGEDSRKVITPEEESEENKVLHTPAGEMPDVKKTG